jgi:hypothetical protein
LWNGAAVLANGELLHVALDSAATIDARWRVQFINNMIAANASPKIRSIPSAEIEREILLLLAPDAKSLFRQDIRRCLSYDPGAALRASQAKPSQASDLASER